MHGKYEYGGYITKNQEDAFFRFLYVVSAPKPLLECANTRSVIFFPQRIQEKKFSSVTLSIIEEQNIQTVAQARQRFFSFSSTSIWKGCLGYSGVTKII